MADSLQDYIDEAIETRRRLHARPELGWTEFETTALIASRLGALGFSVRVGAEALDPAAAMGRDEAAARAAEARARKAGVPEALLKRMAGYTGAIGEFDTGRPGPLLAMRFDIDALPILETEDPAHLPASQGFASAFPGIMHACGHDCHTGIGLALAHWAADHAGELRGRLRFIFQPAEEGTRGAAAMVAAGAVDDADWFIGAHVGAPAKQGEIRVCEAGFMATTKFDAEFTGVASHAGSRPEAGRSALIAAADAALLLTAIPRTSQGDTRVAVGLLNAGEGRNITPAHAHMEFEVRGSTHEANRYMAERAIEAVRGCAAAVGVKAEIRKAGEADAIASTEAANRLLMEVASGIPGVRPMLVREVAGSDDCTLYMRRAVERGANAGFFLYGCETKGHHRPDFDIADTESMGPGFRMFAGAVRKILGPETPAAKPPKTGDFFTAC